MTTVEIVVSIGVKAVSLVCYILLAILAIKRKKVTIESDSSDEPKSLSDDFVTKLVQLIISEIRSSEKAGEQLVGQSGFFKMDRVLSRAKDFCRDNGITVDHTYLLDMINSFVDLMNYNKSKTVQSTGQNDQKEFKFIGVKNESQSDL